MTTDTARDRADLDAAVGSAAAVLGPGALRLAPLGALTTYRVGGPAALRFTAGGPEDLCRVAEARAVSGLPVLVVGRGSNMLVSDAGFPGLAVLLDPAGFGACQIDGHRVRAGAALALPALARRTAGAGLVGFEWAVGVPGSVGGAVRMNAGGHGSDIAATLVGCRYADLAAAGTLVSAGPAALRLGYRRSAVAPHHVVVDAEIELAEGDKAAARHALEAIVSWRRAHQPGGQNAGSVFVNPASVNPASVNPASVNPASVNPASVNPASVNPASVNPAGDSTDRSAGWLVEAAGMKGHRLGTAAVSSKHANFIQADAGGSADDLRRLITTVQDAVTSRFGIFLETEVQMVGFGPGGAAPTAFPYTGASG
ncbi:MAG: UDP-N-acetylmuramate dehydrogenase [Acidimicrobiales bacterium]